MTEIDRTPLLTRAEECSLAGRIAGGDSEARDQLTRANLRLVVSIARRYAGRGVTLEDLIAEGNLGLLRAVEGFDPAAGTRFSTYAAFWVKQSIRVALTKYGRTVRIPQYLVSLLGRWRPAEKALRESLGRAPLPAEVVAFLGLTERQGRSVVKGLKVVNTARATGGTRSGIPVPTWPTE